MSHFGGGFGGHDNRSMSSPFGSSSFGGSRIGGGGGGFGSPLSMRTPPPPPPKQVTEPCEECGNNTFVWHCDLITGCGQNLCSECDQWIHKAGTLKSHKRKVRAEKDERIPGKKEKDGKN